MCGYIQNKKLRCWISDDSINNQNKRKLVTEVLYFSLNKSKLETAVCCQPLLLSDKKAIEYIHSVMTFRWDAGNSTGQE